MDLVISYAKDINENTEVKAFPLVGVHPAEISRLVESGKSLEDSFKMVKKSIRLWERISFRKKSCWNW
ncbi:hypothetical protein [Methanobrevibacter arboriphilus]|uniref:hypothetical protein n=1 Tax=Methanobrevibacter arboriphilus TaxID=39441 RepID=UPI000AF285AE|nr:hypothetical protein [Methanobrevibacter arboriphilus]